MIESLLAIQSYKIGIPGSSPECFKLNISGCESGPSPKMLVANRVIEISPLEEHDEEISPNVWQHRRFKHEEAGIAAESQILPEEASE